MICRSHFIIYVYRIAKQACSFTASIITKGDFSNINQRGEGRNMSFFVKRNNGLSHDEPFDLSIPQNNNQRPSWSSLK